jgi:hypothetical protein
MSLQLKKKMRKDSKERRFQFGRSCISGMAPRTRWISLHTSGCRAERTSGGNKTFFHYALSK